MQSIFSLDIAFTLLDWVSKITLFLIVLGASKSIKRPKQLTIRTIIFDLGINTCALFLFLMISGQWWIDSLAFFTIILGLGVGIITALPITFHRHENNLYSQGNTVYLCCWAMSLLGIEFLESLSSGFERYGVLAALLSLAMLYGASFHLLVTLYAHIRNKESLLQ